MTNLVGPTAGARERYSPALFLLEVVRDLSYELPFTAIRAARPYLDALLSRDSIRYVIVNDDFGLASAALRCGAERQDILEGWSGELADLKRLATTGFPVHVTLAGSHPEPLRFASDFGLCEDALVADLGQRFPQNLQHQLCDRTDAVICLDAALEVLEKLLEASFDKGQVRLLCFSVPRHERRGDFVNACKSRGLTVRCIRSAVTCRNYLDEAERARVEDVLVGTDTLSEADAAGLRHAVYITYRADESKADGLGVPGAASLVVADEHEQLIGCTEARDADSVDTLPHPWHVAVPDHLAASESMRHALTQLHIKQQIQPQDVLCSARHPSVNSVSYLSKLFAKEYEVHEHNVAEGKVRQTMVRVKPHVEANIQYDVPASAAEVQAQLDRHGHVLIRPGAPIGDDRFLKLLVGDGELVDYNRYGNTPRPKLAATALTSVVNWPKDILLIPHNELTYHTTFPMNVAFVCKQPAEHGGETVIYDCAVAFEKLSPEFQHKAVGRHVVIHRTYVKQTDRLGHPSWTHVLDENATAADVMEHFESIGIHCSLSREEDRGRTIEVVNTRVARPLVYEYHSRLCLHVTIPGIAPYWYELSSPGKRAPYSVTWDTGELVTTEEFQHMEDASLAARIIYAGWQKDDVLFLDNLRIAHGRQPLIGKRVVGARLARPGQFVRTDGHWKVEAC